MFEEYRATGKKSSRTRKLNKFADRGGKLQFFGNDIEKGLKKEDILRNVAMGQGSIDSLEYKEITEQTSVLNKIKDIVSKIVTGRTSGTASADETVNNHPDREMDVDTKASHDRKEISRDARIARARKLQGKYRHPILGRLLGKKLGNKLFKLGVRYNFNDEGFAIDDEGNLILDNNGNPIEAHAKGGIVGKALGGFKNLFSKARNFITVGDKTKVIVGEEGAEGVELPNGTKVTEADKTKQEIAAVRKEQIARNDADAALAAKKEKEKEEEEKKYRFGVLDRLAEFIKEQKEHHTVWNSIFSKKGLITAGALFLGSRILNFLNSDFGKTIADIATTAGELLSHPFKFLTEKVWPWLKDTAWPWIKDTAWPWVKEKVTTAYKFVTEKAIPWITDTAIPFVKKKIGETFDWLKDKVWPIIEPVVHTVDNGIKHIAEHFGIKLDNLENQEGVIERTQDEIEDHLKLVTNPTPSGLMEYITPDGEITVESGARAKLLGKHGFKLANAGINAGKAAYKELGSTAKVIGAGANKLANSGAAKFVTQAGKKFLFGNAKEMAVVKQGMIDAANKTILRGNQIQDMALALDKDAMFKQGSDLIAKGTKQLADADALKIKNGVIGTIKSAFQTLIDGIGKKLTRGGVTDASSKIASKLSSYVDDIVKTVTSSKLYAKVSEKIASITAATSAVAATGAGVVAILAKETTWIALGVVNGATGAQRLFQIDSQPDWVMTAISAVFGGLLGTTPGAIIDFVAQMVNEVTGLDIIHEIACMAYNLFAGEEKYDKLLADQEAFEKRWLEEMDKDLQSQYKDYKAVTGKELSYEDYLKEVEAGNIGVKTKSKANFNVQEHKTLGSRIGGGFINVGRGIKNGWQNVFGKKSEVFTDPVTGQAWVKSPTNPGMYDIFKDPSGDLTPGDRNPNWIGMQSENQFDITNKANKFTSTTVKQQGALEKGARAAGKWISEKSTAAGNWISEKSTAAGNWISEKANAANQFINRKL